MNTNLAVTTEQITKSFHGKEVIHDCTMSVESGTIYGFLGKNGAGKTTVFKILLGLLKPSMGKAAVLGLDCVMETNQPAPLLHCSSDNHFMSGRPSIPFCRHPQT